NSPIQTPVPTTITPPRAARPSTRQPLPPPSPSTSTTIHVRRAPAIKERISTSHDRRDGRDDFGQDEDLDRAADSRNCLHRQRHCLRVPAARRFERCLRRDVRQQRRL